MQFLSYDSSSDSDTQCLDRTNRPTIVDHATSLAADISNECVDKLNSNPNCKDSKSEDTEAIAVVVNKWIDSTNSDSESSSDVDDSEICTNMAVSDNSQSRNIESAESLLAKISSKPNFLIRNIDNVFKVTTKSSTVEEKTSLSSTSISGISNISALSQNVKPATHSTKVASGSSGKAKLINAANSDGKRKDNLESAKDRVKKQRLSGQSGLGSDFRVWRSEEEMRQRQMFD